MDRLEALATLPRAYALALRLHEIGADTTLIADCLGIGPESVAALLAVATAKLAAAQDTDPGPFAGRTDPELETKEKT